MSKSTVKEKISQSPSYRVVKDQNIKDIAENLNSGIDTILSEISNPDFFADSSIDLITVEIPAVSDSEKRIELEFVMDILNSMKDSIINSLSSTSYLSELHSELAKRVNLHPKRILEWRQQYHPQARSLSCDSFDIIEILIKWYREAFKADVPYWLLTDEDRAKASYWDRKATDYTTKVFYPAISDIIASKIEENKQTDTLSNTLNSSDYSTQTNELFSLENLGVNWGGLYLGTHLINTCPIDNIITLISINMDTIMSVIKRKVVSPLNVVSEFLKLIQLRDYNKSKNFIAEKLNTPKENGNTYNFYGSEGPFLQFLSNAIGSSYYEVSYQCSNCRIVSDRILNLTTVIKFSNSCQESINIQLQMPSCLKCRDTTAIYEMLECHFTRLPLLFILGVGHLNIQDDKGIDVTIYVNHEHEVIRFNLIGYTVHTVGHFYLRCLMDYKWFTYDGMKTPKFANLNYSSIRPDEKISSVFYILN